LAAGGVMSNTVENSRKLDFWSFTQLFKSSEQLRRAVAVNQMNGIMTAS
jgi:hypothetical protein